MHTAGYQEQIDLVPSFQAAQKVLEERLESVDILQKLLTFVHPTPNQWSSCLASHSEAQGFADYLRGRHQLEHMDSGCGGEGMCEEVTLSLPKRDSKHRQVAVVLLPSKHCLNPTDQMLCMSNTV
jgi:hypothetical protein